MEKNRKEKGDKIRGLFSGLIENDLIPQVQIDNEGLYSVTNGIIANETSEMILEEYQKHFHTIPHRITDALACVGGNSISFAKHFSHVNVVEIDPIRSDMLQHNLQLAGVFEKTSCYASTDYLTLMNTLQQDVIFFDPPWGGPEYKFKTSVDLYIGTRNVKHLFSEIMEGQEPLAKMIVLKAPLNFNKEGLDLLCKKHHCKISFQKRMSKMQLFFIVKLSNVA
jgi:hypothetical protein